MLLQVSMTKIQRRTWKRFHFLSLKINYDRSYLCYAFFRKFNTLDVYHIPRVFPFVFLAAKVTYALGTLSVE